MIQLPEFDTWRERYVGAPMTGLTIEAELAAGTTILQYNPIYLDNLLAYAVVRLAMAGRGLPDTTDAYDIPLPLACLWRSSTGLPLWAASAFYPTAEWEQDIIWLHKRAPSGRWSKATLTKKAPLRIVTSMGPNMERRQPIPAIATWSIQARAIGNAEMIAELLEQISHLGKRRNLGMAHVRRWKVQERDWEPVDVLMTNGSITRAIPESALSLLPSAPSVPSALVGWTPPQWKASLFDYGWPIGTLCSM